TFVQVRDLPGELTEALKKIPIDPETYSQIRADDPEHHFDRAVRFLYLNRTAFAGMYRVNRQGLFNVPFGGSDRTPEPLWEQGLLQKAARALRGVDIVTLDFEKAVD